ncbi:hypothetical protein NVP1077O_34 [Vibrio phage 1.077.O._10N.261.45.A10]|nr:hypothetical protein NVP1070O_34 [Vibrio phage 1.070.O._10N.261.45.B2]AUR85612.1 hypothetical protein NVP1077O_34 [Vibrio phage 1.077.O._10N.261.45.A10]
MEDWSLTDVKWCMHCNTNLRAQDLTEHMPHYRNPEEWPFADNDGDVYQCRDCNNYTVISANGVAHEMPMRLKRRK